MIMDSDLLERREKTFDLLVVEGRPYSQVVATIARQFDCAESTVRTDISRMTERENGQPGWIVDMTQAQAATKDGLTRLLELRRNRQRLQQLAADADDAEVELQIRERIDDSIDLDVALSQSLGHTDREPASVEVEHSYNVTSEVVEVTSDDVDREHPDDE